MALTLKNRMAEFIWAMAQLGSSQVIFTTLPSDPVGCGSASAAGSGNVFAGG